MKKRRGMQTNNFQHKIINHNIFQHPFHTFILVFKLFQRLNCITINAIIEKQMRSHQIKEDKPAEMAKIKMKISLCAYFPFFKVLITFLPPIILFEVFMPVKIYLCNLLNHLGCVRNLSRFQMRFSSTSIFS